MNDSLYPAHASRPVELLKVPRVVPKQRECNLHADCEQAEVVADAEGRRRPYHCHVEDCEDCYGC